MNNLLKIFLIFNFFSSTASSFNNYSQPLPETELKMGQNSSEVIEGGRRKLYFPYLHGGMKATGFTPGAGGELYQRDCTLSFPIMNNQTGKKGFLTSKICVTSSLFVGDEQVGLPTASSGFDRDLGLDYMFVEIYESWWDDLISKKIAYSDQLTKVSKLLEVNIPQNSLINSPVCAYGGTSEYVCGVVLEFNVTIKSREPGSDGSEEPTPFYNVVKVQMEKDYDSDDLGSPVYIPALIPFSSPSKIIANPIGQVVEDAEESDLANIWYYTPLDRILEDSDSLTLLTIDPEK